MYSIPFDPGLPTLQELFRTAGAPSFVIKMVREVAGTSVEPDTAEVYVRYRPARNCDVLWWFPGQSGQPLLVSGRLSRHELGSRTARASFQGLAEMVRAAMGGKICPYKYLPEQQLLLQLFPLDMGLPGLALAASETSMRELFCRSLGFSHNQVRIRESVPVHYKPRHRCVLRYLVEAQGRRLQFFGKVFRDDRGEPMVARLRALKAQLLASGVPWDVAVPVMYVPEARMLVLDAVEESMELSALIRKAVRKLPARETLRGQIARVAEGLFTFQRMIVDGLPCVGPRDMLKESEEELDGLLHVAPALAKSMKVRLRGLEMAASRLPAEEMVLSHGSFRYNQFLCRENTVIALDLDGLCLSGTSADAGEFLAYLDVTALRRPRLRPLIRECQQVFLSSLLKQHCLDPRWLAWYRGASHIKWAQRTFFSLKPKSAEIAEGLLHAEQTLDRLPT